MKILVTGGAGFIGSHLVDRLISQDAGQVIVLDNLSRGKRANLSQSIHRIQFIAGDIRDPLILRKHFEGVDVLYHLAAQSNVLGAVGDINYSFQTNVAGTFETLKAAAAAGVKRVIFTSSREVYGEPTALPVPETAPLLPKNPYGASKVAAEMYCRVFAGPEMEVYILRLSNVYGPRDSERVIPLFIEKAMRGEPLDVFGPDKVLDFLWIDTLTDLLHRLRNCVCPNIPLNIASGKGTNLIDLAQRISSITGNQSPVRVSANREPEVNQFVADIARAQELLALPSPDDPIEHIPAIVQHFSRTILGTAAGL